MIILSYYRNVWGRCLHITATGKRCKNKAVGKNMISCPTHQRYKDNYKVKPENKPSFNGWDKPKSRRAENGIFVTSKREWDEFLKTGLVDGVRYSKFGLSRFKGTPRQPNMKGWLTGNPTTLQPISFDKKGKRVSSKTVRKGR